MTSKTFQPLLFDSFKFTLPKSTYADHFNRKHIPLSHSKSTRISSNNNNNHNSKAKMTQLLTKRSRPFTTSLSRDRVGNLIQETTMATTNGFASNQNLPASYLIAASNTDPTSFTIKKHHVIIRISIVFLSIYVSDLLFLAFFLWIYNNEMNEL